jgi:hypothetical protein
MDFFGKPKRGQNPGEVRQKSLNLEKSILSSELGFKTK